jgi:diaminopimelate decarboxylase
MADFEVSLAQEPDAASLIAAHPNLRMDPVDGLCLEGVPLAVIAKDLGTPCWVYGAGTIRTRLAALRDAFDQAGLGATHIHYAVKANDHLAVLTVMAEAGVGADVVSAGELQRALKAGIPPSAIVFSGVGKSAADLRLAVAEGIAQINVESVEELAMLSAIAVTAGRTVDVVLRVNPDVDAATHAKITTGKADNKFGIAWTEAAAAYGFAGSLPGLRPVGLATHIGSQILSAAPFRAAYARIAELVRDLRAAGHTVTRVDCGGGIGIPYEGEQPAPLAEIAQALAETLGGLDLDLMVEPGRWLVGPAGVLLSAVVLVKQTAERRFVVLDAAMNDLVRPAMYDAWHGILPVAADRMAAPATPADIVGPVCESGDTFAKDRVIAALEADAVVAILDAGAYGAVMSSTYNARPLAAVALVDGSQWDVIRPRQEMSDLWSREIVPARFGTR